MEMEKRICVSLALECVIAVTLQYYKLRVIMQGNIIVVIFNVNKTTQPGLREKVIQLSIPNT